MKANVLNILRKEIAQVETYPEKAARHKKEHKEHKQQKKVEAHPEKAAEHKE